MQVNDQLACYSSRCRWYSPLTLDGLPAGLHLLLQLAALPSSSVALSSSLSELRLTLPQQLARSLQRL
jgi:hypothetical protein